MQTAIEAEVTEFLGRDRYSHGARVRKGSRNGHCPTTVKTTAGAVTIERPKLRGTDEAFASRLLGVGVCRANALESLVIAGFVRGLSVRDVEANLADALGGEAALSKSTVSRVCEAIKDELDRHFRMHERRLRHHHRMPDGARRPGARGLGVARRLGGLPRRLRGPHAAPGAPRRLRRRLGPDLGGRTRLSEQPPPALAIHRARNILAKVPDEHQDEVKAAYWSISTRPRRRRERPRSLSPEQGPASSRAASVDSSPPRSPA